MRWPVLEQDAAAHTLEAHFEDRDLGEVFNAPVDVILTMHDVVVPDLVVVTAPPQITERAIKGAHECYRLRSGHDIPVTAAQASVDLTHPDWPGMTIDLSPIWR